MKDGPLFNRRQIVHGLGAAPFVALLARAARAAAACVETVEETEGPFWVDEMLNLECP